MTVSSSPTRLCGEMGHAAAVYLAARSSLKQLNHLMNQTRNKASAALLSISAASGSTPRRYANQHLIFCDRQNGREHYGHLLRVFKDWPLRIVRGGKTATPNTSSSIPPKRGPAGAAHLPREAESQAMPVAILPCSPNASAKRDCDDSRILATTRPGVSAAGYCNDGNRFSWDIDAKRQAKTGINDDELIRSR